MIIVYEKYTNTVNKIYILKFNRHCFCLSYSEIMGLYLQRGNKQTYKDRILYNFVFILKTLIQIIYI